MTNDDAADAVFSIALAIYVLGMLPMLVFVVRHCRDLAWWKRVVLVLFWCSPVILAPSLRVAERLYARGVGGGD